MNPSQALLLASKQTLMHFCGHLADRLLHLSIKVYHGLYLHHSFVTHSAMLILLSIVFNFSVSYMGLNDLISRNASLWLWFDVSVAQIAGPT